MIQQKEFKGEWMLPGSNDGFSGILKFDPLNGPTLELIGSYDSGFSGNTHEIIHGNTDNGFVTLVDTRYQSGSYSHVTSIQTKVYKPIFILAGCAFSKLNEIQFTSVHFTVFNLLEWLNRNALAHQEKQKGHLLEYERPADIQLDCYSGCTGLIKFGLSGEYLDKRYRISLDQSCKVIFNYGQPKLFRNILNDIFKFIGFMTLFTYEQSYPMSIIFFIDEIKDEFTSKSLREDIKQSVECFYQNAYYKSSYKKRDLHQHLVRYDSIANTFSETITSWFKQTEEQDSVIELLLRPFRDKYNFSTEKFISATRAVESFHRINHKNQVISKEEVREIQDVIMNTTLSDKQKELVNEKLNYAYEPSLRQRLEDMTRFYSSAYFEERVPDKADWIKRVKNLRNHYTHLDKKQKKNEVQLKELFNLTEDLNLLLFSAIFKSIGIPENAYEQSVRYLIYNS